MRRFDLFINPKKDPNVRQRERVAEEEEVALTDEAPKLASTSNHEIQLDYDPQVYFMTGKRTIDRLIRQYPDGNYNGKDVENFKMALQSLKVAAKKYQENLLWEDAEFAWHYLEAAAQDLIIKNEARVQKEYCHAQLNIPMPPSRR